MTTPTDVDTDRSVALMLFNGVDELDVFGPARTLWALRQVQPFMPPFPGIQLHLVSQDGSPVTGSNGIRLEATTTFTSCPRLDVLIVPGGGADDGSLDRQLANPAALRFVRSASSGIVASVCTGALILGAAGLLDGRRASTHWLLRDELAKVVGDRGGTVDVVPERVVDDGDVVTCGGVTSGIDLGVHLVGRLCGDDVAAAVSAAIERETPAAVVA